MAIFYSKNHKIAHLARTNQLLSLENQKQIRQNLIGITGNANKENKQAKNNEFTYSFNLFVFFKLTIRFGLSFELKLGLRISLDFAVGLGLGLGHRVLNFYVA